MAKKSVIPGFSAKRAFGISSAKTKLAKASGIPLTKQGRKRKVEHKLIKALFGKK